MCDVFVLGWGLVYCIFFFLKYVKNYAFIGLCMLCDSLLWFLEWLSLASIVVVGVFCLRSAFIVLVVVLLLRWFVFPSLCMFVPIYSFSEIKVPCYQFLRYQRGESETVFVQQTPSLACLPWWIYVAQLPRNPNRCVVLVGKMDAVNSDLSRLDNFPGIRLCRF